MPPIVPGNMFGSVAPFGPSAAASSVSPCQNTRQRNAKPRNRRNRHETATKPPKKTTKPNIFFNMKKQYVFFVKKMFGFVVFFGGFVAVSWRFRGGFDGFVALRGQRGQLSRLEVVFGS